MARRCFEQRSQTLFVKLLPGKVCTISTQSWMGDDDKLDRSISAISGLMF